MDSNVASSLIGTVGNIAGSLISGAQNYHNTKKLMAYQNDMNVANWQMQNKYNSPGAQMARLREAGLNPSLFYSNGQGVNSASSVPTSTPVSNAGAIDLSHVGTDAVNTYMNMKMQEQQIRNMEVQNNKTDAETNLFKMQYAMELAKKPYFKDYAHEWINNMKLSNYFLDSQIKEKEASTSNIMAATQNAYATYDQIRATIKNIDQDTVSKKIHSAVERALAESNIKLNNQQIDNLSRVYDGMFFSNGMQEIEYNQMKTIFGDGTSEATWMDFLTKSLPTALWKQFVGGNLNFNYMNRTSTFQMK